MAETAEIIEKALLNTNIPTKEPGQLNLNQRDLYLTRYTPPWMRPVSLDARFWRRVVMNQPIAMVCRETLIANTLALDWKISARDNTQQDELRAAIRYYTRLLEKGTDGFDFETHVEFLCTDALDLPFGAAAEIGRRNDDPSGRVQWIVPIDGGTLYPTLNKDFPVLQYLPEARFNPVWFPAHSIARMYLSPRTTLLQQGWGMAPPEKVWFAMELLWRGDRYYANLLLDIPPAGILDLGDMEMQAALGWIDSYKELLNTNSNEAFKIPVLYEHQNKAEFIKLGQVPNDIMFDRITLKYAAIVCAAYGLSLSDVGISASTSNGGETLAGTIRQERKSRKNGYVRLKKKLKRYFEEILPETLQFDWIDYDDELNLNVARARLANATADQLMAKEGIFSREELRAQTMADGLITIPIPEKMPAGVVPESIAQAEVSAGQNIGNNPRNSGKVKNPEILTKPVAPSKGGHGDIKQQKTAYTLPDSSLIRRSIYGIVEQFYPVLMEFRGLAEDSPVEIKSQIDESLFEDDQIGFGPLIESLSETLPTIEFSLSKEEFVADNLTTMMSALKQYRKEQFETQRSDTSTLTAKEKKQVEAKLKEGLNNAYDWYMAELNSFSRQFIVKCVVTTLKDDILSGEDIDFSDAQTYNSVVSNIQNRFDSRFEDVLRSAISVVDEELVNKLEELINGCTEN